MSRPFAIGAATGADPHELINTCINQLGELSLHKGPGFIFCTDALARELPLILELLKRESGIEHWVGSVGMAICTTNREFYDSPALVAMVADWEVDQYRLIRNLEDSVEEFVCTQREWIDLNESRFGLLHGDPTNPATPTLVEAMSDQIGSGFFSGGLTSSNSEPLQVADQCEHGGISGVLLASSIASLTGHSQGCSQLGGRHRVTKASRNIIRSLDHQPALDVLKADIGEVLSRNLNRLGGYIFVGLPILGSDTGDYLVRNLIGIDPERGLLAIGDMVSEGEEIVFCRRDGNTAREDLLSMLESLKARLKGRAILGGIYYSCLGRGRYQFGEESTEMKIISSVLGDFPLAGFFANGEIFHNRIYGYTGVLTVFAAP